MENKKPTTPVMKGLVISLVLIALAIITYLLKMDQNTVVKFLPIFIMIAGIVWACMSYSKEMGGNVTFGKVFGHGFKATAFIAATMAFFVLLMITVLFPESIDQALQIQREKMAADGKMSAEQIDQGLAMGKKMAPIFGPIAAAFLYLIVGAIGSLIGAATSKTNPNAVPFDQNTN